MQGGAAHWWVRRLLGAGGCGPLVDEEAVRCRGVRPTGGCRVASLLLPCPNACVCVACLGTRT